MLSTNVTPENKMPRHKLSLLDPDPYTLEEHRMMDRKTLEEFEGIPFDTLADSYFLASVLNHAELFTITPLNSKWKMFGNLIRLLQSNDDLRLMMDETIKSKQFSIIRSVCEYASNLSLYLISVYCQHVPALFYEPSEETDLVSLGRPMASICSVGSLVEELLESVTHSTSCDLSDRIFH